MYLIGSMAASLQDSSWPFAVRDLDFIATDDEVGRMLDYINVKGAYVEHYKSVVVKSRIRAKTTYPIEVEIMDYTSRDIQVLDELRSNANDWRCMTFYGVETYIPPLSILYLIKKSHIHRPVHWNKNILHYNYLKTKAPIEFSTFELEFLAARTNRFNVRTPKLNMTNDKFFGNSVGVQYTYVHDDIHRAMAYNELPVFEMMKRDPSKAMCDRGMFEDLSYETRLQCVREEAMVIAIERKLLTGEMTDEVEAYQWALMRICTTLTSGWFRQFALDNWSLINMPDLYIMDKFHNNIERVRTDKAA